MTKEKHSTWEEKISDLVTLAQAVCRNYASTETDDWQEGKAASKAMFYAYVKFHEWQDEAPHLLDEMKALVERSWDFEGGIRAMNEFESSMREIKKMAGETQKHIAEIRLGLLNMAKEPADVTEVKEKEHGQKG